MVPKQAWPSWTASTSTTTGTSTPPGPSCCAAPAGLVRPGTRTAARSTSRRPSPSSATCNSGWPRRPGRCDPGAFTLVAGGVAGAGTRGRSGEKEGSAAGSAPAAEPAFAVDDLAGDPGRLVGDQPGDQAGRVVGDAPAAEREMAADGLVSLGCRVAGVDRAGIDGIEGDPLAGELFGQGLGDGGQGALAGGVGDLAGHRAEVLARGHEDDPAWAPAVVAGGERLGQQDRGAGVDRPVRVEHRRVQGAERAVAAAAGVVADQDVQVAERGRRRLDELGRGLRAGQS